MFYFLSIFYFLKVSGLYDSCWEDEWQCPYTRGNPDCIIDTSWFYDGMDDCLHGEGETLGCSKSDFVVYSY